MIHRECRKRSITASQSERLSVPKRRRLEISPSDSPELGRHQLVSSLIPAGSSALLLSTNEIGPTWTIEVMSPAVEVHDQLEGFDLVDRHLSPAPSLPLTRHPSPAPSLPSISESFEVQEE